MNVFIETVVLYVYIYIYHIHICQYVYVYTHTDRNSSMHPYIPHRIAKGNTHIFFLNVYEYVYICIYRYYR